MTPLVYIAGPFRGATPYEVKLNVDRAEALGLAVAKLGGYPVIPHTMTQNFDKLLTDQFWLEGTLALMRQCQAVALTPDWERSTGARAEHAEANRLAIPCFDTRLSTWTLIFGQWLAAWEENQ